MWGGGGVGCAGGRCCEGWWRCCEGWWRCCEGWWRCCGATHVDVLHVSHLAPDGVELLRRLADVVTVLRRDSSTGVRGGTQCRQGNIDMETRNTDMVTHTTERRQENTKHRQGKRSTKTEEVSYQGDHVVGDDPSKQCLHCVFLRKTKNKTVNKTALLNRPRKYHHMTTEKTFEHIVVFNETVCVCCGPVRVGGGGRGW